MKKNNYYKLVSAKFLSIIGTYMQSTAFSLYIIDTLHDSLIFATILMSALLPKIILGPLGGVFVDWFDRKKILVVIDFISGVLLLISALVYGNNLSLPIIYFICISLGIMNSVDEPLVVALIPSLVEKEKLVTANSINMFSTALGNIIGPILGAIVYSSFGIDTILYINASSFIIGAILEFMINIENKKKISQSKTIFNFLEDFKAGLIYIVRNRIILVIVVSIFFQNFFFNGATTVGVPFLAKQILKVSNAEFAILETTLIVGSIFGLLVASNLIKDKPLASLFPKLLFVISVCFLMIGLICIFLLKKQLMAYVFIAIIYICLGMLSMNVNVLFQTEMQKIVDESMFGRVSSLILSLIMSSIPLGQLVYGYLFKVVSPSIPFLVTFIAICCVSTLFSLSLRNSEL
ncbi:mutanobactin A system MFS transporter MubZ [Streptococcus mutans]|uniref:mutanobactin A system MFS transporter MubZ n=1 Tax=Streptococcus mutans TaxID=1309 RepID=UPI00403E4405